MLGICPKECPSSKIIRKYRQSVGRKNEREKHTTNTLKEKQMKASFHFREILSRCPNFTILGESFGKR